MGRGYRDNDSRRYFDWLYYANLDLLAAKTLLSDERCYNGSCVSLVSRALKRDLKVIFFLKSISFMTVTT